MRKSLTFLRVESSVNVSARGREEQVGQSSWREWSRCVCSPVRVREQDTPHYDVLMCVCVCVCVCVCPRLHRHPRTHTYARTSLAEASSHVLAEVALVMVSRVVKVWEEGRGGEEGKEGKEGKEGERRGREGSITYLWR